MELVNPKAEFYSEAFTSAQEDILQEIYNTTLQQHSHAHMQSSMVQGQLLTMFSCMMRPQRILEIGTFTGYSAICLAKGLAHGGIVHTIELREEDAHISLQNFKKLNLEDRIQLHLGNAKDIVPQLNEKWDIVFIDADKTGYTEYYEMVLPRLNTNGIIIADNVLFHGQVLDDDIKNKSAKAIHAFNEHIKNDERVIQVMLTVRDGVTIIRKK